jgi:dethiobiotin synthetase
VPPLDNPVLLPDPCRPISPPARRGGGDAAPISSAYRQLAAQADAVVVEGAGGWRVPLSDSLSIADLAVALQLPVVLVVGLRWAA